ncbi:hypothetical protein ACLOJK_018484 [Asimina triloba]
MERRPIVCYHIFAGQRWMLWDGGDADVVVGSGGGRYRCRCHGRVLIIDAEDNGEGRCARYYRRRIWLEMGRRVAVSTDQNSLPRCRHFGRLRSVIGGVADGGFTDSRSGKMKILNFLPWMLVA